MVLATIALYFIVHGRPEAAAVVLVASLFFRATFHVYDVLRLED